MKHSPSSFREICQWLKFPLNGLRAQSRLSTVVGLLLLASGPAWLGMAFPPFLIKQLYRCDFVVISLFVWTGYTARRWGWLLGRIGYSIMNHYTLYPCIHQIKTRKVLGLQVDCGLSATCFRIRILVFLCSNKLSETMYFYWVMRFGMYILD
jgi:hypothetical protein